MNHKVPVARLLSLTLFCLFISAASPIKVLAQPTHYFPGSNVNYTGGSNSYPLASSTYNKCQFLYKSTDFNSVPSGPFLITTVYIKPSSTRTNQSMSNLTIKLGNSTLTTLSSGAWEPGLTTVYNPASVTISTSANQWFAVTLSTPFLYTGGNLLFELSQTNTSSPGINLNHYTVSGRNGRKYGRVINSSSTGVSTSTALFGFDGIPAPCSGTPQAGVITTAAMNPATPLCAGNTKPLSASNPNGALTGLSFQWQSSSSSTGPFANVTAGSGATTLNYTTPALLATTWFRLAITCVNGNATSYSTPYQVVIGAQQPGSIMGRAGSCPGDTATYKVSAVAGHTYAWTLPSGWTGSSTTNSILVTMGANPGTISVTATGCGGSSIARTRAIGMGVAPARPGAISGSDRICAGTSVTYSVAPVMGANTYTWTLPAGWTGSSGSNSITVVTGNNSGNVTVKANNGCGSSAVTAKAITIISSLASPGPITSSAGSSVYCSGAVYNFNINPVPGATSYQWVLPAGWSGNNSGTSIQAYAGSAGGQIQVTAFVACATSPTSTLTSTVLPSVTPTVSVAPSTPVICSSKPVTFTATTSNGGTAPTYVWKRNSGIVGGTSSTYTTSSLINGDTISVQLLSNSTCRSADTVRSTPIRVNVVPTVTPGISINTTPVITICSGTNVSFTTTSVGSGTAPGYQWHRNGAPIAGATSPSYSSAGLAHADTITVQMTSSAICTSTPTASSNKVAMVVNPAVIPTISITASSTAAGQPVTFTAVQNGGGTTPGYQWMLNGVNIMGEVADTYTSSALAPGDHVSAMLISYDPCAQSNTATSNTIIIGSPTGIAQTSIWNGSVVLYPNPNQGKFTVQAEWTVTSVPARVSLDVFNLTGQRVYHSDAAPDRAKWNYEVRLENTAAGHYILRLTTEDGRNANLPIIIAK